MLLVLRARVFLAIWKSDENIHISKQCLVALWAKGAILKSPVRESTTMQLFQFFSYISLLPLSVSAQSSTQPTVKTLNGTYAGTSLPSAKTSSVESPTPNLLVVSSLLNPLMNDSAE
jgi:hypothetical protein